MMVYCFVAVSFIDVEFEKGREFLAANIANLENKFKVS